MFIVQSIKCRDRHFRFSVIAGCCFLLPEAIGPTQIEKIVATDPLKRRGKRTHCGKKRFNWIGGSSVIVIRRLGTQSILPFTS